jgi:hypothetical protein
MKTRLWLLSSAALSLMGCQEQVRLGAAQTISAVSEVYLDNVANNLFRFANNPDALAGAGAITQSVSSGSNGFNYGVFPGISFRGIGITGLSASASNSINENLSIGLVSGSLDLKRLQMIYNFALRGDSRSGNRFAVFRDNIWKLGYNGALEKKEYPEFLMAYAKYLPDLPNGPFAEFTSNCFGKGDFLLSKTLSFGLINVCFRALRVEDDDEIISGERLASRLALWTLAIPDLGAAVGQPGTSGKNTSSLVIPAASPPPGR